MTDIRGTDAAGLSRLDALLAGSRVMSAWRATIASPVLALEAAQVRRLAAAVVDLDAPSRWRAAGVAVIIAVITHAVVFAVLRVPVHGLGWSMRAGLIAAGLFLARRPFAVAAAWKEKTGE
jgi:hypothetical protein